MKRTILALEPPKNKRPALSKYYIKKRKVNKEYVDPEKKFIYWLNDEMQKKYKVPLIYFNEEMLMSAFNKIIKHYLDKQSIV